MLRRVEGSVGAVETPIGRLPQRKDLNTEGLDITADALDALLEVDAEGWRRELAAIGDYLGEFGERTPPALLAEQRRVAAALAEDKSIA
jgi:phosphoenolpyruvate carboxykinase (GTP)